MTAVMRAICSVTSLRCVAAVVALLAPGRVCFSEPPERPNILLVVIDTLRADSLSCYGYGRQTSPFLDQLAAEGVRFDRAYASCSWTVPSVATMLSSTYVNKHGLGRRFRGAGGGVSTWSVLPNDVPCLAQLLSDGGYTTFGLVANLNLAPERGFGRGFGRYGCIGSVSVGQVRQSLASWLPEIANAQEPWFFWLHLFDPHGPYDGQAPWLDEFDPEWRRAAQLNGMSPPEFSSKAKTLAASDVAVAKACYDSEIRAADELVREVFKRLPGADDAFVLVTSDHGEEFLDHGGTLHGGSLYDEQIRIPFIIRTPDRRSAGTVVAEPVSLVDVLPTLLGAAGLEAPTGAVGINLMPPDGVSVPEGREVFAELRGLRAVIDARFKLITTMGRKDADRLFDLLADPGEKSNLAATDVDRVKPGLDLIAGYEEATRQTPPEGIEIDRRTMEKLRSLGYLGGGG